MKTIGLLGGMSWESTALYYQWINELIKEKLGGLHSAKIAMVSLDFQEIEDLQHRSEWEASGEILSKAAQQIEAAGADFLLICTNTMHKVAPQVEAAINIPLLHIADATADAIKQHEHQHNRIARHQFHDGAGFLCGSIVREARAKSSDSQSA